MSGYSKQPEQSCQAARPHLRLHCRHQRVPQLHEVGGQPLEIISLRDLWVGRRACVGGGWEGAKPTTSLQGGAEASRQEATVRTSASCRPDLMGHLVATGGGRPGC